MKEHAETGWRLLSEQKLEHPVLTMGAVIAKHHHEHWDGNGYPSGLIGDAIPIEARICGLAEVFDALTHKRPWRAAQSVDKALLVIESLRGYQFDPSLTDAFVAMVRQLVEEHGSGLDTYLGQKAQKSALLTTRKALLERSREGMDESESSLA
jgi:putative two-component system response regulator